MKLKSAVIITTLPLLTMCVSKEEQRADSMLMESEKNSAAHVMSDSAKMMDEMIAQLKLTKTKMNTLQRSMKEMTEQLNTSKIKMKTTLGAMQEMVDQTEKSMEHIKSKNAPEKEKTITLAKMRAMLATMKAKMIIMSAEIRKLMNMASQEKMTESKMQDELADHRSEMKSMLQDIDTMMEKI